MAAVIDFKEAFAWDYRTGVNWKPLLTSSPFCFFVHEYCDGDGSLISSSSLHLVFV